MIQEEASIPASFVHCGPHSFTPYLICLLLATFVQCWTHPFSAGHIRSVLAHIRSSLPHSFIADPHSFIPTSFVHCWPHSFSAGPHSFIAGPHSFIADSHPFIAGPHSFIPGHIFHLKNWLNCHLQEKLVVDNNPESAKLEEVSIVQNVTI